MDWIGFIISMIQVDMAASTQWLECQDCQCEEVVEGRCKSLNLKTQKPKTKI